MFIYVMYMFEDALWFYMLLHYIHICGCNEIKV